MKMTIPYKITGKQRKQLAEDISVALHTIPKYLGYPTCVNVNKNLGQLPE
jgi:hypothetical protein